MKKAMNIVTKVATFLLVICVATVLFASGERPEDMDYSNDSTLPGLIFTATFFVSAVIVIVSSTVESKK